MRVFASLALVLGMIGFALPAWAAGLQFCDDIKDDQERMACLQQHISHLEQTIIVLGGRIAALENALQSTLASNWTYKLKSAAQDGKCLGLDASKADVALVPCDSPDSWSVISVTPIKKPAKTATPAAESGTGIGATQPSNPDAKGATPCRNLDQPACAAKADVCQWNEAKKKCARKAS
ncbi:hypothetical protein [Methyloceanibacter sp.]|uniref:hypothetical protein n=1 Tax=Methyloceanibacter sp. TaxID=1965321 RepID=UPI002D344E10|nr:hypothetical protein [Methyloceanibacter sp.]HZP09852.1 hypothetical protein [Methyloceanibacter sp.]